jgi:DNA-directed RNA polymerase subunit RPC12/RpoP
MFFFLIAGLRPRMRPVAPASTRVRPCASCRTDRVFAEHEIVQYFELFLLPLVPVGARRRVWVCETCGSRVDLADPEVGSEHARPVEPAGPRGDAVHPESGAGAASAQATVPIHCVHCGARFEARGTGLRTRRCPDCGRTFRLEL